MTDDKMMCLHDAPIEKFTSFFLYPFSCDFDVSEIPKDWTQSCFEIPLQEKQLENDWNLQKHYAEYIYFHDYVRAFLFPKDNNSLNCQNNTDQNNVRLYRRPVQNGMVSIQNYHRQILSAMLAGIYLYRFPNNIWILVFEVTNNLDDAATPGNAPVNPDTLVGRGRDLLMFNNMFRRVYPAFFEKDDPFAQMAINEFPLKVSIVSDEFEFTKDYRPLDVTLKALVSKEGACDEHRHYPSFESPATCLLESFFNLKNSQAKLYPILDDRMLVHSYVAFQSYVKDMVGTSEQEDMYFSRFLYVDNPESGYRYDSSFIRDLMQKHEYTRWKNYRTRMGFTRYSSMFMFFGHVAYLYRPFSSMYLQMFLLITFYRSSLIRFSNEIAEIAQKFSSSNDDNYRDTKHTLRDLHTQFMKFMNIHWFTEVTNQDQGIEIFKKMRDAFELEPMYKQVKDEIERADELAELIYHDKVERFQTNFSKIGMSFAIAALLTGFFGMNFAQLPPDFNSGPGDSLFWGITVIVFVVIPIMGWCILKKYLTKKSYSRCWNLKK